MRDLASISAFRGACYRERPVRLLRLGEGVKKGNDAYGGLRLVSPVAVLVPALTAGLGVWVSVYVGTNKAGWHFLLALTLASAAITFIVEGVYRARAGRRWRAIVGAGMGVALVSLLLALLPVSRGEGDDGNGWLQFRTQPVAPEPFDLAFEGKIPLPKPADGWFELHRRGGIDIGDSRFRIILANDSASPISVLNVQAEVLGSAPMPHGTKAYRYSQRDEGTGRFVALLPSGRRGTVARLYPAESALGPKQLKARTPYFQDGYVSLRPDEVYPVSLTVEAEVRRMVTYRLIAEGQSATHRFIVKSPPHRLVGNFEDADQRRFARYYSKYHDPRDCAATPDNPWIDARYVSQFIACFFKLRNPNPFVHRGRLNLRSRLLPIVRARSLVAQDQ